MAKYNLQTPINTLFSNEDALTVLKEVVPKLVDSPQASMLKGMPISLEQIFGFMGDRVPEDKIRLLEKKLAELGE